MSVSSASVIKMSVLLVSVSSLSVIQMRVFLVSVLLISAVIQVWDPIRRYGTHQHCQNNLTMF